MIRTVNHLNFDWKTFSSKSYFAMRRRSICRYPSRFSWERNFGHIYVNDFEVDFTLGSNSHQKIILTEQVFFPLTKRRKEAISTQDIYDLHTPYAYEKLSVPGLFRSRVYSASLLQELTYPAFQHDFERFFRQEVQKLIARPDFLPVDVYRSTQFWKKRSLDFYFTEESCTVRSPQVS